MRALRSIAICLALAAVARADDACLSGAALLGDQRALATLRVATEATCPCTGFSSHGGFQKCARGVMNAALTAGTLRAACKARALTDFRASTCGTNRVTCGRVQTSAKTPLTCRVKRPASCHPSARYAEHTCVETHCTDVVDTTASTCVDPRAKGTFEVGVQVVRFTKLSAVDMQPRDLDTVIWYPTPPGAGPIDAQYGGVLNAPLDNTAGPYPLLLFSHGSCGYPLQSKFLLPVIASHGFIVAAPPHPGNTLSEFPACGSPTAQVNAAIERPQDMIFVLDSLLAANGNANSPFFSTIDPNRVGMSGHSFGGFTTYRVIALDSRFKVAVPLAAAVPGSPVLTVPSLTMLGQIDAVVNLPKIRQAYADAQPPKYLVEIANTGHYAFSDGCFASPDCNPPVTMTQDEAHAAVSRWVLPFVEVYLAGDQSFAPFLLAPPPPGFLFDASL